MPQTFFDIAYQKEGLLFGATPTRRLREFLDTHPLSGSALDLGCGDGRDTVPLLKRGFQVTALDVSEVGITKLLARNDLTPEMKSRLTAVVGDIRTWQWPASAFDLIVGTTVLDHIQRSEISGVVKGIIRTAKPGAAIFVEVHTTDDPAVTGQSAVSEFAEQIKLYFEPNELLDLLHPYLRVLLYEERTEWDYDHGEPHTHGFATLVGKIN